MAVNIIKTKDNRKGTDTVKLLGDAVDVFDRNGALDRMGVEQPPSKEARLTEQQQNAIEKSPLQRALYICDLKKGAKGYQDYNRSFTSEMIRIGMKRSMEIVRQFEREMKPGERKDSPSLALELLSRLKDELPPSPPNP